MRKVFAFGLVVLVPILALAAAWSPLHWSFNEGAISKAIQELRAAGDPLLAKVEALDPQIEKTLGAQVAGVFVKSTNDRIFPVYLSGIEGVHKNLLTAPERREFDSITGRFLRAVVPDSIRDAEKGTKYTYRICEAQPNAKECLAWEESTYFGENASTTLARAFVRRVLSTQAVAESAYEALVPYAHWCMRWTREIARQWDEDSVTILREELTQLKNKLMQTYLAKPWSPSLCDQDGHSLEGFICRRYLDGGPQLILKYAELLERALSELAPLEFPEDQLAWKHIDDMFGFQKSPAVGKTYQIQTRRISAEVIARIMKLAPPGTAVDFDRNDKAEISSESARVLGIWLSDLDPKFTYRLATVEEVRESDPPITFPCVFEYLPPADLVKIGGERYFDCEARDLIFIRE